MTFQESAARVELAKAQGLSDDRAAQMRRIAIDFSKKVEAGRWLVELELAKPDQLTLEQKASLFRFKREVVHEIVKRVDVNYDKTVTVEIEMRMKDDLGDEPPCQVCDSPTKCPACARHCATTPKPHAARAFGITPMC